MGKLKQNNTIYAEIVFPVPLRQAFSYAVPESLSDQIEIGCRVKAPFGKKLTLGYVSALGDQKPEAVKNIKEISLLLDSQPIFPKELFSFLEWVADYYMVSLGEVCSAAYPYSEDSKPKLINVVMPSAILLEGGGLPKAIRSKSQQKVIEFLLQNREAITPSDLSQKLGISLSPIKTLKEQGWIIGESIEEIRRPFFTSSESQKTLILTEEQVQCLLQIERMTGQPNPRPILIQGVTGSGKTEIYLQAIEQVLKLGKNAIVLIPEIALTPQTMDRFRLRFGDYAGILHSGLGDGERFDEWRLIRSGKRRIVVGTRSAIFAPLDNIGMIIVDEEHESSYKQSDPSPRYHGRDLAVARACFCGAICLLGSATPSLESAYNARTKKYHPIYLMQRAAKHGLPEMTLLDMRGRLEDEEILANELQTAITACLEKKQQSILFLNRRGFATTLTCKKCGQVLRCKHCSVALVYHRKNHILACHHCEYRAPMPNTCPFCSDPFIRQQGFGTERVVHELETKLPEARILRMDRDTTSRKGDHDRILSLFRNGEADILVGTQMIAKGLDFPNVTLVGIINADYALSLPDFRAGERTFSLLTQVAGRAGRGTHAGEVFVQSYCPDHYSIQLALDQNYEAFYEKEIRYRRLIGFPPFYRLILWRIEARNEDYARGKAWELYESLKEGVVNEKEISVLPPVEAPIYVIRDYYRWQVILKSRDYRAYRPVLNQEKVQKIINSRVKDVRIVQDIDPWDLL